MQFFDDQPNFIFCKDIPGVIMKLGGTKYIPADWRLLIDTSKRSPKCVLLHITSVYGSIPIGHSKTLKREILCNKKCVAAYQIQRPPTGDVWIFKDCELLAWTTKWLHEVHMLSLLLGQQR